MAGNANLGAARAAKNDEFYTQWRDIENEMLAYTDYNPDVFRDKVVLLPCDDPAASNFTKYFALNFESLGLKKLISTSYAPRSNPAIEKRGQLLLDFELGEDNDPKFNDDDTWEHGRIYVLERGMDSNGDGLLNKEDLQWEYLKGDGDFRSSEVTALRDEADIVVSNPPFSLFREFMSWLREGDVFFSIIGNNNAITYKEIFPLIKENKVWKGATANSTDLVFEVPLSAEVKKSDMDKAARFGYESNSRHKYTRLGNAAWFTNIEHGKRHEALELMTMEDNKLYNKRVASSDIAYRQYDNYNSIEIPFTNAIPSDYAGVMGVPISFLDKYNPDQFEVIGYDGDDHLVTREYGKKHRVVDGVVMKSNTGTLGCTIRMEGFGPGTYFDVGYPVKNMYKRIFIRHRQIAGQEG